MKSVFGVCACLLIMGCSPQAQDLSASNEAIAPSTNSVAGRNPAGDGPFGLSMGAAADTLEGFAPAGRPHIYKTSNPPRPHPDFSDVIAVAYPGVGICTIRGIGRDIPNDGAGHTVRSKVDELSQALETRYGQGRRIDTCSGSSVACESQFWMMTLMENERTYAYIWDRPNETMKQSRIRDVYVGAESSGINSAFPMIEYTSENRDACDRAARSAGAEAL